MKNRISKIKKNRFSFSELLVCTLCCVVIVGLLTYFITIKFTKNYNDSSLSDIENTYNKILDSYYEDIDKQSLADSAIDGMMGYLNEKYSIYLDSDSTVELNGKLEGEYQGIGVQISKINDSVIIVSVFNNSPAFKAGVKEGDILKQVDSIIIDKDMKIEEVVALIKNKKKINLKVERDKEEKEFEIEIKTLDVPCITSKIFENENNKIGYIYIESFTSTADKQFKNALNQFKDIDSLIVDVRSNSGGYLTAATNIASLFLKKGKAIYSLESKNGKETTYDKTETEYDKRVVVLIDSKTASASEVLAAALKESYGAVIIGTKSYGKGRVQQTSTLSDDTMVKYTTARWYSPLGNSIDGIGITPGITANLTIEYAKNPSDKTDSQLQKAIEYLTK